MKNETDNPESRWWIGCVTRSTFQTNSSSRVVVGIASRIGPSVRHWKHRYPDVRLYFNEEDQKDDYVGVQPKSRSIKIERIELARQREKESKRRKERERERDAIKRRSKNRFGIYRREERLDFREDTVHLAFSFNGH